MRLRLPWQIKATYPWISLLVVLIGGLAGWK